jgi:predicted ThiF/HesA family dinucleotide-utilizing enzyme
VDLLFIDTSHYYEHTLQELRTYVPRVRPGGTVLMHDTELTREQITAYEGRALDGPGIPVAQALDDYCAETGLTWTNTAGCFGLGRIDIPA